MKNRRRKDDAHDVGDSAPGTYGDSQGAIHDTENAPSYDPRDVLILKEGKKPENKVQDNNREVDSNNASGSDGKLDESKNLSDSESTRLKYAKKYGELWSDNQQKQFLKEVEVTASELGWSLSE